MKDPDISLEPTEPSGQDNQLQFLVTVISRFWKLILVFAVVGSAVFAGQSYYRTFSHPPSQWRASQELAIKKSDLPTSQGGDNQGALLLISTPGEILDGIDLKQAFQSAADALIKRREEREAAAAGEGQSEDTALESAGEPTSREDLIKLLTKSVQIVPTAKTGRLSISSLALGQKRAEDILVAAREGLVLASEDFLSTKIEDATAFLVGAVARVREKLSNATDAELAFLREKGFHTYEGVRGKIRAKDEEMTEVRVTQSRVQKSLADIDGELRRNKQELPLALSQITDSIIAGLLSELEVVRRKELTLSMIFTQDYQPLQQLRDQILEKEQAILEAVRRFEEGKGTGSNPWDNLQNLRRRHTELQLEKSKLESHQEVLKTTIEELFSQLPQFADNSQEYSQLQLDVTGYRQQYDALLRQDFELRSAAAAGIGRLEPYGPMAAVPIPGPPVYMVFNILVGALAGVFLAVGLAVTLEMMDTSVRNEADVTRHLGLPVIGMIPLMRFTNGRRRSRQNKRRGFLEKSTTDLDSALVTMTNPNSPVAEAYRTLRTNIQFATVNRPAKTIMVTSAVPGEGKTTTSTNLAIAMAASGARILLLDADLRRPNVHRMFKINRSPGLAEVLAQNVDIHEVMQPTPVDNLLLVPSGRLPANPSELIGSHRMRELVAQLGREFDVVICDAPSVIVVTDAMLLATQVDSVLMLVSVNNARRETIRRALRLLETTKCNLTGIVINGLQPSARSHYYYYYYYEDRGITAKHRWYNS